ncbi:hypothetical protein M0R45_024921 [Rubus argutus]|uniref:Transmembrane protein n=1 Tax=Rubus argutus TaxID=59490 RepID=A0AAW1WU50_RUBAR
MYVDIRHFILLTINMFKNVVGMPWDWDPFNTISKLTWINASLLLILFLVFSFISIKVHVPFTLSAEPSSASTSSTITTRAEVLLRFGELTAPLAVALMAAALVLPQALFWYAYPIILIISSFLGELKRFANWFYTVLTTIPVLNVIMRATMVGWQALGTQPDHQINEENEGNTPAVEMLSDDAIQDIEAGNR